MWGGAGASLLSIHDYREEDKSRGADALIEVNRVGTRGRRHGTYHSRSLHALQVPVIGIGLPSRTDNWISFRIIPHVLAIDAPWHV